MGDEAAGHDPTRQMIEQMQRGDCEAQRRFFERFGAEIKSAARRHRLTRILRRHATLEDVLNEVWLRFHASGQLAHFEERGPGSTSTFLGKILDRTLMDMVRRARAAKRGGKVKLLSEADEEEPVHRVPAGADPSPTSQARADEMARLCDLWLAGRERAVWRLSQKDMKVAEIARQLSCTPDAVRSALCRARHRLKAYLERGNVDDRGRSARP
ncbi:MAG: sigma-70 family RNA polymerase sigma factor [Planctomycetota bacterium]